MRRRVHGGLGDGSRDHVGREHDGREQGGHEHGGHEHGGRDPRAAPTVVVNAVSISVATHRATAGG